MKDTDIRLITTIESFKQLENDWNDLYDHSQRSTIFSSWDWLFTWWEVFQKIEKRSLFIICQYKNEKLIGIAPFQIETSYPISLLHGKTLRFIGTNFRDDITTEYSDLIVRTEDEEEFSEQVFSYLIENKKHWDFADFEFLLEDALILRGLKNIDHKIHFEKIQYGARFVAPKSTSFDDYQTHLSSRWTKAYKRKHRALERDGNKETESISEHKDISPMFNRLADMHRKRWQGKLDSCSFDGPEFKEFHLKILERLSPKHKANITTLKKDDEPLASIYTFEDKGQVHYYQSGFYPEHGNRYSPLFLLMCDQVGEASTDGKLFDFMFDDNLNSYKNTQYAAEITSMYRIKLSPKRFRLTLHNAIRKAVSFHRKCKQKLTSKPFS